MKTNLKTCPDSPWKTAFEKELRETLAEHAKYGSSEVPLKLYSVAIRIKEILGE